MYANEFDYYRADSVDHALELLTTNEGARPIAGSHGLVPRMRTGEESPPTLVDITDLGALSGIDRSDDAVSIGALTTHAEIAESEAVFEGATAMAEAANELGDPQVRNGGTIGGNLAHGDARADLPAALLALDGELVLRGADGDRTVGATDLFRGHFRTTVDATELVTAVRLPVADDATSAYVKRRNPLSGYALVGVAARLHLEWGADDGGGNDDPTVTTARVAVTGATTHPTRLPGVEDELEGATLAGASDDDVVLDAAARATEGLDEGDYRVDVQTSPEYLEHLLPLYTERAVRRTLENARER